MIIESKIIQLFMLFFLFCTVGVLLNSSVNSQVRLTNLFYICFMFSLFIAKVGDGYYNVLKYYALLGVPVLLYLLSIVFGNEGRGTLDIQPNYFGLVVLSVVVSSLCLDNLKLKIITYFLAVTVLLFVSSRASLLCTFLVLLIDGFLLSKFLLLKVVRKEARVVLFVFYMLLSFYALIDILADIFYINDSYRGIESGLSGRDKLWALAIDLWKSYVLFGVGYGNSSAQLGFVVDNAYINALLEVGVLGFLVYLMILIFSFFRSLEKKKYISLVIVVIYCFYGVFEKRYLNIGNSFSLLFILTIFDIFSRKPQVQKG